VNSVKKFHIGGNVLNLHGQVKRMLVVFRWFIACLANHSLSS
jgi:hypothetical protein